MDFIGFDLGKASSQICIITADGELVEQRIKTDREQLTKLLGARPRSRVLIEAGTESEWVARHLEALGHEAPVAGPNFAPMYATRSRRVKTDRRDARAPAEACRLGAYRPAHRTSDEQRHVRAKRAAREAMARTRAKYISLIRALLRRDGFRVPSGDVARTPPASLTPSGCAPTSGWCRANTAPASDSSAGASRKPGRTAPATSWSRRRGPYCAGGCRPPPRCAPGRCGSRSGAGRRSRPWRWPVSWPGYCTRCGVMPPTSPRARRGSRRGDE